MKNSARFFSNKECEYYPCHKGIDELNCLFCFCPFYPREKCPGKPVMTEKNGRIIKSCINCTYPHDPDHYDSMMRMLKQAPFARCLSDS